MSTSRSTLFHIIYVVGMLFSILCPLSSIARADQSTFGPYVGRTLQVLTERRQYGDVLTTISLGVLIPDTARVYDANVEYFSNGDMRSTVVLNVPNPPSYVSVKSVNASCEGSTVSNDPTCVGVRDIDSCDWKSLSTSSKTAINNLLGPCTGRVCSTAVSLTSWGELITVYSWTCLQPNTANCVLIAGMENRIDVIKDAGGCQY